MIDLSADTLDTGLRKVLEAQVQLLKDLLCILISYLFKRQMLFTLTFIYSQGEQRLDFLA